MAEYSTLLAGSVLRRKAWLAEHTAQIETLLANTVKSEFIANMSMSHELRTPLNTVIGFAKLISEHRKRQLKDANIVAYVDRDAATHLLAVLTTSSTSPKCRAASTTSIPATLSWRKFCRLC
jgi:signal transduction histidine kinase